MSALGAEFKINIHCEPIDGFTMNDFDFECELYALYMSPSKKVLFKKSDPVVKVSEDGKNCVLCITSSNSLKLGRGRIMLKFTAHIPDSDFPDGYRTEIEDGIWTTITIT